MHKRNPSSDSPDTKDGQSVLVPPVVFGGVFGGFLRDGTEFSYPQCDVCYLHILSVGSGDTRRVRGVRSDFHPRSDFPYR